MIDLEDRKTLAYVRVSTEHQELDRQRDMIRRWCIAYDVEIDQWMEDEGISGRADAVKGKRRKSGADMAYYAALCLGNYLATVERPGFLRMLQAIEDGHYKRVIVAALDRLSRDMVELMLLSSKLDQCDCELIAVDSGQALTTEDASGWMQYAIKSVFAEYECRQTGDRTKQGLAARKASGKMVGRAPTGWRRNADNTGFITDPKKWPRIKMVAALRKQGFTLEEIGNMAALPWVNSRQAVSKWEKSWHMKDKPNFNATAADRDLSGVLDGIETKTGVFVDMGTGDGQ